VSPVAGSPGWSEGAAAYRTILAPVQTELEIKRSRFLCFLFPAESNDTARDRIRHVRALHPKARHHCTAFVLGSRAELQRTNDDGEPSGTAGAPMLDALVSAELNDVVAVVVRYFGGVLLGAGGLTRAYRAAVAEAISAATVVVREQRLTVAVTTDYAAAAQIEAAAAREAWVVSGADYGADVTIRLGISPETYNEVSTRIAELTAGQAKIDSLGTGYVTVPL
jgi:uncharacterized YigZ family protein